MNKTKIILLVIYFACIEAFSQHVTDANSILHNVIPVEYATSPEKPKAEDITVVLLNICNYLDENTPAILIDKETKKEINNLSKVDENSIIKPVDFRLISYEWGVTYAGMLLAAEVTGDNRFTNYTYDRFEFLSRLERAFLAFEKSHPDTKHLMKSVLHPNALDDAGAMCAAMIKAKQDGCESDLDLMINNFMDFISNQQFRFPDGTLARNFPFPNTLWLDDLFMSVPALAQMGKYTGDTKYYDDAIKQLIQFSERMFNAEKGLYMHGWVEGMDQHPQFHWARANGWAVMSMVELLEVLPNDYKNRDKVLALLRKHVYGLAKYQSKNGMWHQLIDREDSYLETSATAIYTYSIARAINRGWIDASAYKPMVYLAWNAVANQVNEKGQVENTCVGTGLGFEPAYYFYRPVSVYTAHGYGPVLLAGAEIIKLLNNQK